MLLAAVKIKELKENALLTLEQFLLKRLKSANQKELKFVQTLSFWMLDYVRLLNYENNLIKYKKYKRGDIIKVNFGHRIGREHGGLHYAVVLDTNNAIGSNLVTVIPLTSIKPTTDIAKLGKDRINIGNEIYKSLVLKVNSVSQSEKAAVIKELTRMKSGSIALIGQITTVSKYRIYDPLSTKNVLHGIKLSDQTLTIIDNKIKELFTHTI